MGKMLEISILKIPKNWKKMKKMFFKTYNFSISKSRPRLHQVLAIFRLPPPATIVYLSFGVDLQKELDFYLAPIALRPVATALTPRGIWEPPFFWNNAASLHNLHIKLSSYCCLHEAFIFSLHLELILFGGPIQPSCR